MPAWLEILANAWNYPSPGMVEALESALEDTIPNSGRQEFEKFLDSLERLPQGEREALYTRTFDLAPLAAPYVGFHTWGETYGRGSFLASLSREMRLLGIDPGSELPDHLDPLLRYLAVAPAPLPDALQALPKAIRSMQRLIRAKDPRNPYLHLLAAVDEATRNMCATSVPVSAN